MAKKAVKKAAEIAGKNSTAPLVIIIVGQSGSGLTTALNILQDNNFYCIDNLPLILLEEAAEVFKVQTTKMSGFAVGIHLINAKQSADFAVIKKKLQKSVVLDVVFLSCEEETILSRYTSSRRKHPLMDQAEDVKAAVRLEKKLLTPVENSSNVVFDTTIWSPQTLQKSLEQRYKSGVFKRSTYVTLCSFGFKYGGFPVAENIFDVRFLENPYFYPHLKELTGLDLAVKKFIFSKTDSQKTLALIEQWMNFSLPRYHQEGKNFVRIGIGCTGGKHRSVAVVEKLFEIFSKKKSDSLVFNVVHRNLISSGD